MIHVDFVPGSLTNADVYTDRSGNQWQVGDWWTQWKERSEEAKSLSLIHI